MSRSLNHGYENKCSEETFNEIYNMAFARGVNKGIDEGKIALSTEIMQCINNGDKENTNSITIDTIKELCNKYTEYKENAITNKGFLDVKVGDIIVVYDEYNHDYEEHDFRVESIEYDDEYITDTNPQGMRCYGIDLNYYDEETQDFISDEYIGVATEGNFVRFKE